MPDTFSFEDVWEVLTFDDKVYFQTEFNLLEYDNNSIIIHEFDSPIVGTFKVNNQLYLQIENVGLRRFMEGIFVPIPFGDLLNEKRICGMVKIPDETILIATTNSGLYELKVNQYGNELSLHPIKTQFEDIISTNELLYLSEISNDLFSVGTKGNGVLVFDKTLNIKSVYGKNSGLHDLFINHQCNDESGNLWFALGNGISQIKASNPITKFNQELGLNGIV